MRRLLIGMACLGLVACQSVEVAQYSADTAMITVRGNAYVSAQAVQVNAMRQAAMKTIQGGFDCFVVTGAEDEGRSGQLTLPGNAYTTTTGNAYAVGNMAYGQAQSTTTYTPPQTFAYYKPGIGMQIQMFHEPPASGRCFEASEVLAYTNPKR